MKVDVDAHLFICFSRGELIKLWLLHVLNLFECEELTRLHRVSRLTITTFMVFNCCICDLLRLVLITADLLRAACHAIFIIKDLHLEMV